MSEVFIATEEDGSEWVSLEDYQAMKKIAIENKLIAEQFQKLLGVYTTTDALVKVVELTKGDGCPKCGGRGVHKKSCPEIEAFRKMCPE